MDQTYQFFIVSDGSGETAVNLLRSLLTQFTEVPGQMVQRRYPKVKNMDMVDRILNQANAVEGPIFVVYTLVNERLRNYFDEGLKRGGIQSLDLFTSPLHQLSVFLGAKPEANPDKFHGINEQYFKRMEAIEFTLNHDDGKLISGLDEADIVLVGVSRTGKTPLSMYLALYGYKVVNIPLARGVHPPAALDQITQRKVVCLSIDPMHLAEIRRKRMTGLSVTQSEYSDPMAILEEIEEVNTFFKRHRRWPVIDVTNRSIEETAGLVRDRVFGRDRLVH